jgi:hypothetical protein
MKTPAELAKELREALKRPAPWGETARDVFVTQRENLEAIAAALEQANTPAPNVIMGNGVDLSSLPNDVLIQAVKDRCSKGTSDGAVLARELAKRVEELERLVVWLYDTFHGDDWSALTVKALRNDEDVASLRAVEAIVKRRAG